jgi:hypothetical protein
LRAMLKIASSSSLWCAMANLHSERVGVPAR